MKQAWRDLARVVAPVVCPGCGQPDVRWCDECEAPWWQTPARCDERAARLSVHGEPPIPVWSVADLDGTCHHMIAAWKDSRRRDLDGFFAAVIERAAYAVAPALPPHVVVVPAPARRSSTRRRGVDLPLILAGGAARGLRAAGVSARSVRALESHGRSSRGASARERGRGTNLSVRAWTRGVEPVVLVDDVLTTGATMAACIRALEGHGAVVVAGVTIASAAEVGNRVEVV